MIVVCLIGIFYFSKFKFFPICSLSRLTSHTHTHIWLDWRFLTELLSMVVYLWIQSIIHQINKNRWWKKKQNDRLIHSCYSVKITIPIPINENFKKREKKESKKNDRRNLCLSLIFRFTLNRIFFRYKFLWFVIIINFIIELN